MDGYPRQRHGDLGGRGRGAEMEHMANGRIEHRDRFIDGYIDCGISTSLWDREMALVLGCQEQQEMVPRIFGKDARHDLLRVRLHCACWSNDALIRKDTNQMISCFGFMDQHRIVS